MSLAEAGIRECIGAASVKHPVMDMKKAIEHVLCVLRWYCMLAEHMNSGLALLIWAVAADAGKRGEQQPAQQRLA